VKKSKLASMTDVEPPTTRQVLRGCGQVALELKGYSVRQVTAAGIVPGARLQVKKPGDPRRRVVAVRTSKDRKVGLMRDPDTGKWRTIPDAHLVIVAVQAQGNPSLAEVFCFEPDVLVHAFDALAAKILAKTSREKALKSPIFIALDHQLDDPDKLRSDLKRKSSWSMIVPLKPQKTGAEGNVGFVERVKREFAELNGVDISKVLVNFQITG
jgi:hypothetical protein